MSLLTRLSPRAWVATLVLALLLAAIPAALRLRHVLYVTDVAGRAPMEQLASRPADQPRLIVPGHPDESLGWLDYTRQMFARHEGRVRHIDYENAPFGHDVSAMSPYRWWLGLLAGADHLWSGRPAARAVELTAVYADPLLEFLLLVALGIGAARWLGSGPAAVLVLGIVCLYPLNTAFLPGVPSDRGLILALQAGSLLVVLCGLREGLDDGARRRWFAGAGAVAGLGLWVNVAAEAPVVVGIAVGGLFAAFCRRGSAAAPWPWRTWSLVGALTVLAAYLAEFFPAHLGAWDFRVVHPLFGLVWLGAADLLARLASLLEGRRAFQGKRDAGVAVLSVAGVAALPIAFRWGHSWGFLAADLNAMRLNLGPGSPVGVSTWAWFLQTGVSSAVSATLVPLLLAAPAIVMLMIAKLPLANRAALAFGLGPVIVTFGWACRQIADWSAVDVALLVLAAATVPAVLALPFRRVLGAGVMVLSAAAYLPGLVQGWPTGAARSLAEGEVYGLVERDLARWLAQHAGPEGATVLAPPEETIAFHYYAGIRGLGTFGADNRDGWTVAVRMVSATTPEEAAELFARRGVTYVVMPSWDPYFDVYARMGQGQVAGTFLERLHEWILPAWLRPVAYPIPSIPGFEGQSVTIFEVVEEQDAATAAARLAEFFVDLNQPDLAAAAGKLLRRFPADLGAAIAQTEVAVAAGDTAAAKAAADVLVRRIATGADRDLPWEERIALSVVLAQTHHLDLVKTRLTEAMAEADAEKLRALRTSVLYRLEIVLHLLGIGFPNPELATTARELLPADLLAQLGPNVQ